MGEGVKETLPRVIFPEKNLDALNLLSSEHGSVEDAVRIKIARLLLFTLTAYQITKWKWSHVYMPFF